MNSEQIKERAKELFKRGDSIVIISKKLNVSLVDLQKLFSKGEEDKGSWF